MADASKTPSQRFKVDSQHEAEIGKFFHPKHLVVTKLPDVKAVRDTQECSIRNADGSYTRHQMMNGSWIQVSGPPASGLLADAPTGVPVGTPYFATDQNAIFHFNGHGYV